MSLSDMVNDGWRFYRPPEDLHIDCAKMRPLEEHLWTLAGLLDETAWATADGAPLSTSLVTQWLHMAAGLEFVRVDKERFMGPIMCSSAGDYSDADNFLASTYATEHTRLLYIWCATEQLLRILGLPKCPYPPAQGDWQRAMYALKLSWEGQTLPEHYECVRRHLRNHVDHETPSGADERKMFEHTDWRGESGVLLAVADKLRHPHAHGSLTIPPPWDWGEDASQELPPSLHAPRLATRGLALSIAMLLRSNMARPMSNGWMGGSVQPWRDASGAWNLTYDADPAAVLATCHIAPPDDLDDDDPH